MAPTKRKRSLQKPKPKHKRPTTTALARVDRSATVPARVDVLPAAAASLPEMHPEMLALTEDLIVGQMGRHEVKLSAKEEQVLARAVKFEDVRIKPTGQVYLSHPMYRRWLSEAFGRLGWSILPATKPVRVGNSVVCGYKLYVHGYPVAFAWGEQEYFENNREQTFGDALEATDASALRRLCKRLGLGLELWDKEWGDRFIAEHCVKVRVKARDREARDRVKVQWRRKVDPKFWNELDARAPGPADETVDEEDEPQRRSAPEWEGQRPRSRAYDRTTEASRQADRGERSAGYNSRSGEPISEKQLKRLWVIIRNSGRNEELVHEWLQKRWGYQSTKKISRADYEQLCQEIEAPGHLDMAPRGGA